MTIGTGTPDGTSTPEHPPGDRLLAPTVGRRKGRTNGASPRPIPSLSELLADGSAALLGAHPSRAEQRAKLVEAVNRAVNVALLAGQTAEVERLAGDLADALIAADDGLVQNDGVYSDSDVQRVNAFAAKITLLDPAFSLSDIDRHVKESLIALAQNAGNLLTRLFGVTLHEGEWDGVRWDNWNDEFSVFPERFLAPLPDVGAAAGAEYGVLEGLIGAATAMRVVGGGHSFNCGTSTGGTALRPLGELLSLDAYADWWRLSAARATEWYGVHGTAAEHVVRVQAGIRLRDFSDQAWQHGLAMSVAGSTNAQSIGGLIATDLHGTGRKHGFLSEQLLEVTSIVPLREIAADGSQRQRGHRVVYRRRDPAVAGGGWSTSDLPASVFATQAVQRLLSELIVTDAAGTKARYEKGARGKWSRLSENDSVETAAIEVVPLAGAVGNADVVFEYLPVAGAIGLLGVVVEAVCQLERAYNLRKEVKYVARRDVEARLPQLLEQHDHVSFYFPGGVRDPKVVRCNTWDRTEEEVGITAKFTKAVREELDHVGAAFLPQQLASIGASDLDNPLVQLLNREKPVVLPAPAAFARQLYYEHDEIEYGIPIAAHAACLAQVMDMLADEEFTSVVEVRFTPDTSEALLGPGTAGRGKGGTCFIELASADGEATELRVAAVYQRFHEIMHAHGGRVHLGKKAPPNHEGMREAYGDAWLGFLALRQELDPCSVFLPAGNPFLRKLVPDAAGRGLAELVVTRPVMADESESAMNQA